MSSYESVRKIMSMQKKKKKGSNLPKVTNIQGLSRKSNHCQYNENGLCDIHVTWQPRRADWHAYA